jgi:hypothetical protein
MGIFKHFQEFRRIPSGNSLHQFYVQFVPDILEFWELCPGMWELCPGMWELCPGIPKWHVALSTTLRKNVLS